MAVWGKTSDGWTFVGAAIIVAATSYIAHREARAGRKEDMTDRLAGKVALITGGASGLGANAAALMAQEGARVVVADIAVDRGKAVADKLGSAGHFVKLDVTSEDNWKAAIAETVDKFGAIHVLLNSAGIGLSKTVEDITLEEWRRVHAIDLDGVFLGCKHGVGEIKKHTHKLGGSVINISSISGIIAGANMAAYNSAKAGVRLLEQVGGAALRQVGLQHPLQLGASHLHRHADPRPLPRPLRQRGDAAEARPPGADRPARPARGSGLGAGLSRLRRIELHDRLGGRDRRRH